MFRPASRVLLRTTFSRPITRAAASRRFLSTAPPAQKSRSWKNAAVRWGLAASAIYYYNTHDVFAEEPAYAPAAAEADESESLPTIEQISAQRRQRLNESKDPSSSSVQASPIAEVTPGDEADTSSVEGLEAEADQQGAFNPETGEINWDCPCLGGMANGPCGEEFKAAFSCFVYSTEEPKGMDCIDRFKGMQDCFRQYPDIYGAELEDDEDDVTADDLDGTAPVPSVEHATSQPKFEETPSPVNNAVSDNNVDNAPAESKPGEDADSKPTKKETEE